eukprot:CAMPEP_0171308360 /NCGR_PEP_ID=MMETSP0816-20121228/18524_1 /TAXON_ID=420281 /ORGANISM="Proboscia inermis, Strain CCAP1064/1" /LENGTH=51 /DNA_ID=CAMNT_0011791235 /DNA_START=27 /DNA_END=182 /DNA_ORIENTATION=+
MATSHQSNDFDVVAVSFLGFDCVEDESFTEKTHDARNVSKVKPSNSTASNQ